MTDHCEGGVSTALATRRALFLIARVALPMLIDALEKLAAARGAARLTADVSDSAQEFFKARGYLPRQRNTITLGDEWLANTTMDKQLIAKERAS